MLLTKKLKIVDNQYIFTKDGCLGVSIGYNHPNDGIFSLIMCVPPKIFKDYKFPKNLFRNINGKEKIKIAKLYTLGRKRESYDQVLNLLAKKFPYYDYQDDFWGHINFIPNKLVDNIIERGDYQSDKDRVLLSELADLFGVERNLLIIVGSRSLGPNNSEDLDITIKGTDNSIKVRNKIRELVKLPEYQSVTRLGTPHPRRFVFKDNIICPSFLYKKGEEPLGRFKYRVDRRLTIKDKVIDDTHSTFVPVFYRLEKNGFLLSYFIDHRMLLKKGDKIEFKGTEVEIKSEKFSGKGLLVNSRGEWIKILKSRD